MKWFSFLLFLCGASLHAALLYDNTTPVPLGAYHNLDANATMLDDVFIPLARLGGANGVIVRRVQFQVFSPTGGAYNVTPYFADGTIVNNALRPALPPTALANQMVNMTANEMKVVTIGDGVNELFRVNAIQPGISPYKAFFFGLKFYSSHANIGWVHANGPDFNINAFYGYYGPGDTRNGEKATATFQASFYLKIDGEPVPEPLTLTAMGTGLLVIAWRRKRAG
jgi:hypothetical protein